MAALELARRGDVTLAQPEPFGDIAIARSGAVSRARSPAAWRPCCSCRPEPAAAGRALRGHRGVARRRAARPGRARRAPRPRGRAGGGRDRRAASRCAPAPTSPRCATGCASARPTTACRRPPSRRSPWSPTSSRSAARRSAACAAWRSTPRSRPWWSAACWRRPAARPTAARCATAPRGSSRSASGCAGAGDLPPLEGFELSGPEAERVRLQLVQAGHLEAAATWTAGRATRRMRGDPDDAEPMRVHRALALAGVASRRAAEALVAEGRVTVNGAPRTVGQHVGPGRRARRSTGSRVRGAEPLRAYLLHKARGRGLDRERPPGPRRPCSTTCPTPCASTRSAASTSRRPGPSCSPTTARWPPA